MIKTFSKKQASAARKMTKHPDARWDCPWCDGKGIYWHPCGHVECCEPCSCVYETLNKRIRKRKVYQEVVDEALRLHNYALLKDNRAVTTEVRRRLDNV